MESFEKNRNNTPFLKKYACYLFSCLITLLLFISGLIPVNAQETGFGFSMFNNRNHPHLKWMSAETEHFIIHYPEHLSGIENKAAPIAEVTYEALSKNFDVTFDYKIRIYLSDEDEIVNGFAVPFNRSYTNIWVHLNDVANSWSGPEKWLRTVIAHELAHIFHFEAVKSNIPLIGILGTAPGLTDPWTEGIAQYQTEPWHALRGDAILRQAFYDGRPSFRDNSSVLNRRLMYASGNSQLRYFASVYGDSLLPEILAQREKKLFGLIRIHNFEKAFESVTGSTFDSFEGEWRRHMNIYYHTIAGQMERSDSLGVKPKAIPGLFINDLKFNPDTTRFAALVFTSSSRPYNSLYIQENDSTAKRKVLAEGSIRPPISWSPDGESIVYSANVRGINGSLLNDLYRVNIQTGARERLTHSRRASSPVFSKNGNTIYYIVNEAGTGNIVFMELEGKTEHRLTQYEGDVQIGNITMHPEGTHLAYSVFDENGGRRIAVIHLRTASRAYFTNPRVDDRNPVWSPDGKSLLYTSLRDNVPNLFLIRPFEPDADANERRVTALFTGGTAHQWLPADSLHTNGRLILTTTDSKRNNRAYLVSAGREVPEPDINLNPVYKKWTNHQPPNTIPEQIEPDPELIQSRSNYNSWRNITHVTTVPFPVLSERNIGVGAMSLYSEPLSKHMVTALGAISLPDPWDNSVLFLSYINNQLRPTLSLNLYHNSFTGRIYERDFLVTTNSGGFILSTLPHDWIDSPFVESVTFSRFRYDYTDAKRFWDRDAAGNVLELPQNGWQNDIQAGIRITKQKPYAFNLIHPLDGAGVEVKVTAGTKSLGGETQFFRPDFRGYATLPAPGSTRIYLYARAIAQWGDTFPQDYIGFSRYDEIELGAELPGLDILYKDTERVRGFSDYVPGNRMLFGTLEYRVPFIPDLNTQFLGVIGLGRTSVAFFADAGAVWTDGPEVLARRESRLGLGAELKNMLRIGPFSLVHSLGIAQPSEDFGGKRNREIYYRVKAVLPF